MNISREGPRPEPLPDPNTSADRTIGRILVEQGKLKPSDAERVLAHQRHYGVRFGDAAVKLGLVSAGDVQHALARQFDYQYLLPEDDSLSAELVAAYDPFGTVVESLRAVRSQLMLRWFAAEPARRMLAIVSTDRGDGRSFLAANLAIVFSQLGERTLLIDADLRQPRQHELFRLPDRVGLSSLLAGRDHAPPIHRVAPLVGLSVLPAGATPPNPQELLSRGAFAALLEDYSRQFDVILIDTPPTHDSSDARVVAARAGACMLVARSARTRLAAVRGLAAELANAGSSVVGSMLNDI